MSDFDILRPATQDEKRDFIELREGGSRDFIDAFMEQLAVKQSECQKSYTPFDGYSARIDFEDAVKKAYGDAATVIGDNKQIKLPKFNLDKYAEPEKFDLIEEQAVVEDKLLDGIRNSVQTGKNFRYRAKLRGNGITIFVPNLDLKAVEDSITKNWKAKETKKKE
jgi:hypothetical protein